MANNRLALEASPYLLQHKSNPVDWYAWGDEALDRAKREDKPILLSIGYSSCHWCHVMAHESFEDEATANVMNDRFVNIKVDREERPDIDIIYQSALALMGQQGGWPLTMFLTPDAKPFWGGTYFPPEPRYGRPGFKEVIVGLHDAWTKTRDKVLSNVGVISEALDALAKPQAGKSLDIEIIDKVASGLLRAMDPVKGGFRGAPKFPQAPFLKLLWRAWRRTGSTLYFDAVMTALDHMAQGGIYDHIGGGFARYSTDENWLVPHFEKMLYDNAQLISVMSDVYKETRSELYAARVRETIEWMYAELSIPGKNGFAFASALDADSEDETGAHKEGAFYVWHESEVDTALGRIAPTFKQHYTITTRGNWSEAGPGVNVIERIKSYPREPAVEAMLTDARATLKHVRDQRPRPGRDGKVLADLNGLAIQALVDAALTFEQPSWLDDAKTVFAFICQNLTIDGRLQRSWTATKDGAGRASHRAVLDDIAHMSKAALCLYEATGEAAYLAQCESWITQADDLFWCDSDGGYCLSARDARDVITRTRISADNAVPNGNGTMADVLARLYLLTGSEGYRAKAQALINAFPAETAEMISNMPTLMNAYELLANGAQVVITGNNGEASELLNTAFASPGSLRVVLRTDDGAQSPGHPAHGKSNIGGKPAAYVCRNGVCENPVTSARDLRKALESL